MSRKPKHIKLINLSLRERTELRVKTLALLRFNRMNVRRTSREAHVHESTIRAWLREDNDVARELAQERAQIQDQERVELRRETVEKNELADLHNARLIHDKVEDVMALAVDRMTALANELVDSMRMQLSTEKVSFSAKAMSFGIFFDKLQIFQGNPTSIHASLGRRLTREQRAERARQLLETAEQRQKKLKVVPRNAPQEGTNG